MANCNTCGIDLGQWAWLKGTEKCSDCHKLHISEQLEAHKKMVEKRDNHLEKENRNKPAAKTKIHPDHEYPRILAVPKVKLASERSDSSEPDKAIESDEKLYLNATNEFESEERDQALWAKALAKSLGDERQAKYSYINLAVEKMKETARPPSSPETNLASTDPAENSAESISENVQDSEKTTVESASNFVIDGIFTLLYIFVGWMFLFSDEMASENEGGLGTKFIAATIVFGFLYLVQKVFKSVFGTVGRTVDKIDSL